MPFLYDTPGMPYPATQQIGDDSWVLERAFTHIHPETKELTVIPPSGPGTLVEMLADPVWVTDYRSGPDYLDGIIPKQGHYSAAWLKHDFGYASESKPRAELDRELYEDLRELGAGWSRRMVVWSGVRLGGGAIWAKHDPKKVALLREYANKFR